MFQRPYPGEVEKARHRAKLDTHRRRATVQRTRRRQCYRRDWFGPNVLYVTNPGDYTWAGYLRRMTERPGWSVARLARESRISTARIWAWLKGEGRGGRLYVGSVVQIAEALGDDPIRALRAAAELPPERGRDEDIDRIVDADWPADVKARMIQRLIAARMETPPADRGEEQDDAAAAG